MSQDNTATPSGRILIVDDDMMMRELMKEALVRDDYIIEEVDNGLDALAAVRNSEPDMILLDVKMPGMSGFEVCSEIRTNLNMQGISVVMVTGLGDSESIEKAFSLGATAFINKPINSITFRYQIQYLLKARNAFVELKERETHLMESLRHSEYLLRHAQRIGHLGNWSLNLKTNELSWSDEIYRIYGYEPGNIKPTRDEFFKVEFEEDNARLEQFEQSLLKSDGNYSIEHRIRLPNDEIRWVHEQGVGSFDDQGKLIEVNGTVQDITDRIRQKEQEIHDQKMDAVGQLTSGIAHDFGNLMKIAQGNLELLDESFVEQYGIDSESMDILDDARSSIHDSVELTKQLLASSRRKSIAPEYLNIRDTIFNFSKLFKNTLGGKIELSIHIESDLPDILVDFAQFESSLFNVVINARDAMPDGGILSIDAEVINCPYGLPNHSDESGSTDRYVHIYIKDSGTGMNSEVLRHATEPFFTMKKDAGTGLGLSMVYGFMRQSMGELGIESEPGQGTRITMQFPVYGGKETIVSSKSSYEIQPFNGETVLVVEDRPRDPALRFTLPDRLNLNILEAENASAARQILDSNDTVDLLFTDILMPGEMNGRELANWATKKYPRLKVLLTTASEIEATIEQPVSSQRFPLLSKPYRKNELIKILHDIFQ